MFWRLCRLAAPCSASLSMLRAASPHQGRAASHLPQVIHWLRISTLSTSYTSKDPNSHFKAPVYCNLSVKWLTSTWTPLPLHFPAFKKGGLHSTTPSVTTWNWQPSNHTHVMQQVAKRTERVNWVWTSLWSSRHFFECNTINSLQENHLILENHCCQYPLHLHSPKGNGVAPSFPVHLCQHMRSLEAYRYSWLTIPNHPFPHVFSCCKICWASLSVWHVSLVMNSCQWLDFISILHSGSFDLNITLPSSTLQPLEARLEVESSQQGVLKTWRWEMECVHFFNTEEILTFELIMWAP